MSETVSQGLPQGEQVPSLSVKALCLKDALLFFKETHFVYRLSGFWKQDHFSPGSGAGLGSNGADLRL